jgi:hypothetical protein
MMLANLLQICGKRIIWTKYNLTTGLEETLTGILISAGETKNISGLHYAIIEEPDGREWITLASCVKGVVG